MAEARTIRPVPKPAPVPRRWWPDNTCRKTKAGRVLAVVTPVGELRVDVWAPYPAYLRTVEGTIEEAQRIADEALDEPARAVLEAAEG